MFSICMRCHNTCSRQIFWHSFSCHIDRSASKKCKRASTTNIRVTAPQYFCTIVRGKSPTEAEFTDRREGLRSLLS